MQLLRAFVHWDHENPPTAPVFAGVIHSCQSRQYFAVTSGLESHNRLPRPVLAGIQKARGLTKNHRITLSHQRLTQSVNFADNQKYNKDLPWMN
jgi:hypothetical protein